MSRLPLQRPFWPQPLRSLLGTAAPALPQGETHLDAGSMLAFEPRAGQRVVVMEGTLRITQAGDSRDFTVRAGDTYAPASHGRVVAQADTDVKLRIVSIDRV